MKKALIIVMILSLIQCKKDMVYTTRIIFVNETISDVNIKSWMNDITIHNFSIESKDIKSFTFKDGEVEVTPSQFFSSDSAEIIFSNNKKNKFAWYREISVKKDLLQYNGYEEKHIGTYEGEFIYRITQEHLDSAK